MACNPRCNSFNVLCSICWFSFLLWCYDHLCVVTRCEYIHIWEENRKSKQTDEKKTTNFRYDEDAAAVLGEKAGTWPSRNRPRPPTGVIIRPRLAQMGLQVRGQGLVRYSGNFLALPSMAGENTESPALRLSLSSPSCVVRTSTVKIKGKKKQKQPSTLSLLSLQRYETSFSMVCCKNRAFFFLFF